MKRCSLIINPISGTSDKSALEESVRRVIEDAGMTLDVHFTERPHHATELARRAAAGSAYAVIVAGGDGTINEVATALIDTPTTMAIIPMGSGNGLARHLCIPPMPEAALSVLTDGNVVECDYCTVNDRPFFCTFGVGFDAIVSDYFSKLKGRGLANYVRSVVEKFVTYQAEEYVLTCIDTGEVVTDKALLVACCNAAQYGNNVFIAPRASITDGKMDITVIHAGNWVSSALCGLEALVGATPTRESRVHRFRSSEVLIERKSPGPVHLDGEPRQMDTLLHLKCHPGALRIFSPGEMQVKPLITPVEELIKRAKLNAAAASR